MYIYPDNFCEANYMSRHYTGVTVIVELHIPGEAGLLSSFAQVCFVNCICYRNVNYFIL